jgi:acyl-coenzyme A synthetase/AMP-(fatty) acid ligase
MDAAFWRQLDAHSATSLAGVPYTYDMLLKLRLARIAMPSVRTLTQAGGRMGVDKQRQVHDICTARGIKFVPMYGQTEATARIAWLPPEAIDSKAGSIGRAIPGGRMWLENAEGERVTQAGMTGELIYAGPNVSMGYAQTRADLQLGDINEGVLRTGDLAHFDEDGFFFIDGRLKRFLKIFGNRISLDAVEQWATTKGHTCAAHGQDDRLVLHVAQTPQTNTDALRAAVASTLGVHVSAITVAALPELPRLPSGKVDYSCLSQLS